MGPFLYMSGLFLKVTVQNGNFLGGGGSIKFQLFFWGYA